MTVDDADQPGWLEAIVLAGIDRGPRGGVVVRIEFRPLDNDGVQTLSVTADGAPKRPILPKDLRHLFGDFGEIVVRLAHAERDAGG